MTKILQLTLFLILVFITTLSFSSPIVLPHELTQKLDKLAEDNLSSGVVFIAQGDEILLQHSFGMAIRGLGIKNTSQTKFKLASLSKMWTSLAIAKLVDEGQISLESPASRYIPDWLSADKKHITIAELLNHTSGFQDFFSDRRFREGSSAGLFNTIDDFKELILDEKLKFVHGTDTFYSNSAYIVLGAIIERVSGMNYFDYLKKYIFDPAEMHSSGFFSLDFTLDDISLGYIPEKNLKRFQNNIYRSTLIGSPAGDGYATALDLFRFKRALQQNQLLTDRATQDFLSMQPSSKILIPKIQEKPFLINKYGLQISHLPSKVIGHGGESVGISTIFQIDLDNDITVIILSNLSDGRGMEYGKIPIIEILYTINPLFNKEVI